MEVTDVKVRLHEKGQMVAFADIEFDSVMQVKGWKVFKGKNEEKYNLQFPAEMDKKGESSILRSSTMIDLVS